MPEVFGFKENFHIGPGGHDLCGKYRPDPSEVVVEVYNDSDELLIVESFDAGISAPRHSCYVSPNMKTEPYDRKNGFRATIHVDATTKASLEWVCPPDAILPFDVPTYITSKQGVSYLKMWWGSNPRGVHE